MENYETNPKFVRQKILPNTTPTSTPLLQGIIRDNSDPIYESFYIFFPTSKNLETNGGMPID